MGDAELSAIERQAGGVVNDSNSCAPFAAHFGDAAEEYRAARSRSAIFNLSDRTQVELTGADRAKFLHNFCTNDIKALTIGTGCEAFVTNVKGRVLGHVFVFAGADSIVLESVAGAEEPLTAHFERYIITEDVELNRRSSEWGELLLTGPQSVALLQQIGVDTASLPLYGHCAGEIAGIEVFLRRVDLVGSSGFLLSAERESLTRVWNELSQAGACPAGAAAFHSLRIEALMPLYGIDISEENMVQEVGRTGEAVSFKKGCYLGQEPIARIDALGHVNRQLRGLRLDGGPVPGADDVILAPGSASEQEKEIGRVTSSAVSYSDNRPVALGYVRSQFATSGAEVTVKSKGDVRSAHVFGREIS